MATYKKLSNYIEIKKCKEMDNNCHFAIECLICGEPVPLTKDEETRLLYGRDVASKICDKCKQAVLHVRKQLEENNKDGNDYDKNV